MSPELKEFLTKHGNDILQAYILKDWGKLKGIAFQFAANTIRNKNIKPISKMDCEELADISTNLSATEDAILTYIAHLMGKI